MKKIFGCVLVLAALSQSGEAQSTRYIVQFKNKGNNPYSLNSPSVYLSQKAIERRSRYSITIDSTDLPVTPAYIDSVRSSGVVTILNVSKWLNSVSILTTDAAALVKIGGFPFVQSVTGVAARIGRSNTQAYDKPIKKLSYRDNDTGNDFYNYGLGFDQVHLHNGEFLHNIGLRGQGMIIGMLDGGFNNYHTVKALDSARANGQFLGVYDFVAKDNSVHEDQDHGMQCLSTIVANIPGQFVGTAPKANFLLFRTEQAGSEYPIEEHNWVCGAERIDSLGGDLISSSVGYSDKMSNPVFDHSYSEMNGNTTMAAVGADLAAKKGILVVNSAGNDGSGTFRFIGTPADGDSVLAVGAVTIARQPANFSSYGPSSDGQVKPDVAALGVSAVVQFSNNSIGVNNGTSFACPIIAGLSTCLWQGFREFNNMKIMSALRQSGSKASSPDNRVGYGIPDVKKAVMYLLKEFASSGVSASNCTATLQWTSKDVSSMKYIIERKIPGQNSFVRIGEKPGTGALFTNHSYQYVDTLKNVPAGSVSYRILQIIDTSKTGFSGDYITTASANISLSCSGEEGITVIPNPVVHQLTLKISALAAMPDVTVTVFNSKGQLITQVKVNKPHGVFFFDVPVPFHLSQGKYYLKVYNGKEVFASTEFIKLL